MKKCVITLEQDGDTLDANISFDPLISDDEPGDAVHVYGLFIMHLIGSGEMETLLNQSDLFGDDDE